jgi:hypothetical protein
MIIRWMVGIETNGDRIIQREEVVELADAVARLGGIASGIGTTGYGAKVIVFADTRERAIEAGKREFAEAVKKAGLPIFPIVRIEAVSEDEDD